MNYFAYGSNMLHERLEKRVGKTDKRTVGFLCDYVLKFNKWSIDGSGKANIIFEKGGRVWGIVYKLTEKQLAILDRYEIGYSQKTVSIHTKHGDTEAVTYIDRNEKDEKPPYGWYLNFLLKGSQLNRLPEEVISILKKQVIKVDPDENRRKDNFAVAKRVTPSYSEGN